MHIESHYTHHDTICIVRCVSQYILYRHGMEFVLLQNRQWSDGETYISSSGRHGSPPLSDKFVGIQTDFNDVVEQSKEGSQRERCDEDGGETKLENCRRNKNKTLWVTLLFKMSVKHSRERRRRITHFKVFIHQSVSVHRLQIPVFVPLWKLTFTLHILPTTTSFLDLPTGPPVLQQTENAQTQPSNQRNYLWTMIFLHKKVFFSIRNKLILSDVLNSITHSVIMMCNSRITKLHEVVPDLFEEHDHPHLQAQINQTTAWMALEKKKNPQQLENEW